MNVWEIQFIGSSAVSGWHYSIHINRKPCADKSPGKLTPTVVLLAVKGTIGCHSNFHIESKKQLEINGNELYDGVREGNNMSEICYSWSGLALFFWYLYLCVVFIQQIFPQFSCFSSGVFSPHFWCVKQNFSDNFHILIIVVTCWVMAGTDQNIDHHQQYNLSESPPGPELDKD